VQDVALGMQAVSGPDVRVPISLSEPGSLFAQPLARDFTGARVAWLGELGLPWDKRIWPVMADGRSALSAIGCRVEDAAPDFAGADMAFKTLRALGFFAGHRHELAKHRDKLKDTVIWNTEQGAKLTAVDLVEAEAQRTALWQRVRAFMDVHPYMVLPVSQVPPFDVSVKYIDQIDGVTLPTYIDWMKSCYYISVLGLPAISVPCGFTHDGLPVGIQIVGRHGDDFGVLQIAHAFEQATQIGRRRPAL
jgi:amidase